MFRSDSVVAPARPRLTHNALLTVLILRLSNEHKPPSRGTSANRPEQSTMYPWLRKCHKRKAMSVVNTMLRANAINFSNIASNCCSFPKRSPLRCPQTRNREAPKSAGRHPYNAGANLLGDHVDEYHIESLGMATRAHTRQRLLATDHSADELRTRIFLVASRIRVK